MEGEKPQPGEIYKSSMKSSKSGNAQETFDSEARRFLNNQFSLLSSRLMTSKTMASHDGPPRKVNGSETPSPTYVTLTLSGNINAAKLGENSLYLTNVTDKLRKPDLRLSLYTLFSTYGPVLDVVAMPGGKMRGQAHVVFRDIQTSTQAMRSLQGFDFFGKDMVRASILFVG